MIFFFLLLPLVSFSHVIQDDVMTTDRKNYSFKNVCSRMVSHEAPLVEVVSGQELDCMGQKISVSDFCDKELAADPYYLRAYMNKDSKEVVCQSGKTVLFKYLCVKFSDKAICNNQPKKNCLQFKDKLARRLDLVHFSQLKNEKGVPQLNCFFKASTETDKILE